MTANTKMTGYWTKVLEIIPVHLYGTLWTERRNSLHILLKETYQAGRAEMAEDVRKACKFEMENHFSGKGRDSHCESIFLDIDALVYNLAQRDGGKK